MGPHSRNLWRTFRRSLTATYEDRCLGTAKSAAYSSLVSFFPLLATLATLLIQADASFVSEAIYNFLAEILPPDTGDLVFNYFVTTGKHPALVPVTAMVVSVWGASGAMVSLMEGFRAAYRIPSGRPFLPERGLAILLVVFAATPVIATSALLLFGVRTERWVGQWLGLVAGGQEWRGWISVIGVAGRYLVSFCGIALGASVLYRFGPNRPQRWRNVWPGAMVATLLWFAATSLFAWYARNIANYNVLYGSIAAVIALLVWMYVLAVIAFIGCEFNALWETGGAPAAAPDSKAP